MYTSLTAAGDRICIIFLDDEQSLTCWKATLHGRERIFRTPETLLVDGNTIRLESESATYLGGTSFPFTFIV